MTPDEIYTEAVMKFRRRVEVNGESWQDALSHVIIQCGLGLGQIAQITKDVHERYTEDSGPYDPDKIDPP